MPHSLQAALTAADGDSTVRTTVTDIARGYHWPKSFTARMLRTQFVEEWHEREEAHAQGCDETRYWQAYNAGDAENTSVLTSEAISMIRDIAPAGDILRRMVPQAEAIIPTGTQKC